jgi:hypothetical protein
VATTTYTGSNGISTSFTNGQLTVTGTNAVADGATKGVATFTAADFNDASGVISLDYTNGQKASGSQAGFLASTDFATLNNKISSTSLSATFPLAYNSTTGAFTFNGLGTSTAAVVGNIPYFSGVNTFANVATGTITCSGLASCGSGSYVIGSNLTITGSGDGVGTWFAPTTYAGSAVNSTTTALWLRGTTPFSLIASSTFVTQASSTQLTNSGNFWLTSHTNGLLATGLTGLTYATASSTLFGTGTGGQVLTWNNGQPQWVATTTYANGTGISTSFANGQLTITNTGVTSLTAGNGISLSASTGAVTVTNTIAYPFPSNATTTLLSFGGGASTTQLSVFNTAYFGGTATSTFTSTGALGIASSSPWALLSVNPSGVSGPAFAIGSSTGTTFVVGNGGNVGIGSSSPTAKLAINAGNILQNSGNPVLATSSTTGGQVLSEFIVGKFLYVGQATTTSTGFQIFDISNPTNAGIVGTYNTIGDVYGIAVAGKYAYLSDLVEISSEIKKLR